MRRREMMKGLLVCELCPFRKWA